MCVGAALHPSESSMFLKISDLAACNMVINHIENSRIRYCFGRKKDFNAKEIIIIIIIFDRSRCSGACLG